MTSLLKSLSVFAFATTITLACTPCEAQHCDENRMVLGSPPVANSMFGMSTVVDGNRLFVGAPGSDHDCLPGRVTCFEIDTDGVANPTQTLFLPGDPDNGCSQFSYQMAATGEWLFVGAWRVSANASESGAVYVFRRSVDGQMIHHQTLVSPEPQSGSRFGNRVAVSGDTCVVGAYGHNGCGSGCGAAYAFVLNNDTWTFAQKLVAPESDVNDQYGVFVDVDQDWIAIGARKCAITGNDSGAAYVFERTGATSWALRQRFTSPSNQRTGDFFGSVAISLPHLLVGAPYDDTAGPDFGAVTLYSLDGSGTWSQSSRVFGSEVLGEFGSILAIDDQHVVIGANTMTSPCHRGGSAFTYDITDHDTLALRRELRGHSASPIDYFGNDVDLDGDLVAIAAHNDDPLGYRTGAVYLFGWDCEPPCPADHDRNGFATGDDFDSFVADFVNGSPTSDFNQDCFVNGNDFDAFVAAFEGGCE